MKILLDARLYGLENAGLGRYLINLVDGLSKLDSKNKYIILLRKKYFDSLELPVNWKKVLADFVHYSLVEQIKVPLIIKREKPDISHFPHFNVPILFRGKYIVTIHDMLMHKSVGFSATTLPALSYIFKRLGYRIVFDNAVRRSELIIAPTQTVKDELVEKYNLDGQKVEVTYEGVDGKIVERSDTQIPKPYFVYTGNAYPHKNIQNAVKAIKILNKENTQKVFLVIASARNIFTQRIEKMIQNEAVGGFVKMLGFVPDEKLGSLYKNSTAFVFPSFSEGFGLPGLEALSSGTLLLASNIKVFKEVYDDNALYFDPNDPYSIAAAMKMSLSITPEDRIKSIKSSQEFVKKYSWDRMAEETLNLYAKSSHSIRQSQ